jgi:hypothetical protein
MISRKMNELVAQDKISLSGETTVPRASLAFFVILFIFTLLPPTYIDIGDTRLSFSRIFLLLSTLPILFGLLSGKAGRIMVSDYLMILYSAWIFISYTYHYGTTRIGLSGITVVEQLGAYLVGRYFVRNIRDYTVFIRTFFLSLLVLFPFALFELFTGRNIWAALFDPIFAVHVKGRSAYGRMGLERVMSGFEHPILYGLFCSLGVANFFYVFQPKLFKASIMMLFSAGMTFMSLSSAPLMAVGSQALMILWDKLTKGRWVLLAVLAVTAYVTVDMLSNRTPVTILIGTLTFDPHTAWTRVAIWNYGSAAVLANPIMGIGLEDWPRAAWVTSSVDNFWLLISMRHGLPAIVLLLGSLAFHLAAIMRAKNLPATLDRYRTGYLLALLCLYFTLCTVHVWGAMSSFVFFYIGAGLWFIDAGREEPGDVSAQTISHRDSTYLGRVLIRTGGGAAPSPQNRPSALPHSRFVNSHNRRRLQD